MALQNFFRHSDFREILDELVRVQKEKEKDFNFSKLAQILGVQKTFVSKVMSGGGQLSADQVYILADFFRLTKEEHDYFWLLIECERTGLAKRKQALEKRIGAIQATHRNTKKSLQAKASDENVGGSRAEYYLDPFMTIVHLFLTLPVYAGDSKKVAQKLRLTDLHANKIFAGLERMGLIERLSKDGFYRVLEDHIHLTSDSFLITPYQALFRMASLQELMRAAPEDRFAFSVTFSADEGTRKRVHEAFLKFLREVEPLVKAAPGEEVYQLNFDLFSWSRSQQ